MTWILSLGFLEGTESVTKRRERGDFSILEMASPQRIP